MLSGAVVGATGAGGGGGAAVVVVVSLLSVVVVVSVGGGVGAGAGAGAAGDDAVSVVSQTSSGSTEEISRRIRSHATRDWRAVESAETRSVCCCVSRTPSSTFGF